MLVVNFFGAPSSGKSTAAAQRYTDLKRLHKNADLVNEFPKELVYENNTTALGCQPYIFAEHLYRLKRLQDGGVDYAICDSPLILSSIYSSMHDSYDIPSFHECVLDIFNTFNNDNIFLRFNPRKYQAEGRIHSEEDCIKIDLLIEEYLNKNNIPYIETSI